MAEVHADHPAVRDDEDIVTVRVARADLADRLLHPAAHVRQRLAAGRRTVERRSHPRVIGITVTGADLVDRAALPLAE
jgi:hypothetical protein